MTNPDAELDAFRAHLRRRAGSILAPPGTEAVPTDRGRRLALAVAAGVAGERQASTLPWHRLEQPQALRPVVNRTPILAAAAVAWTLVVALVVAALPGLLARPAPAAAPGESNWYLTDPQLSRVVSAAATTGENVGRTIVANVQITQLQQDCAVGPCGFDTFIAGIEPRIPVTDAELPASCPAPAPGGCTGPLPPSGPTALTIEAGSVKFVATLTDRGLAPDKIAYTVAESLLNRPGGTYVVSAWLWGLASPACPETASDSPEGSFGCGPVAWLTDNPPTSAIGPLTAIRVQNDAYPALAPGPGASANPPAQHGTFLVSAIDKPNPCFDCDAGAVARLVQPIDTITIPPEATPAITLVPTPDPIPSVSPGGAVQVLGLRDLVDAVSRAAHGAGAGRIVVADVTYVLGPALANQDGIGTNDCSGMVSACVVRVDGSDPPIEVRDTQNAIECGNGVSCQEIPVHVVPRAAPAAVRLEADGSIDFIGYVVLPSAHSALSADDAATLFGGLRQDDLDSYRLYVVTGWLSQWVGAPKCLLIVPPGFGCGRAAWISDTQVNPNDTDVLGAPPSSLRVQNEAYTTFAPRPQFGFSASLDPEQGVFLVRPLVPVPPCFECGAAAAEIVARLDPPETASGSPTPEPSATIDPMATYAASYAAKFEHSRATGDFAEAWTLLGSATRAVFGTEARFATQQADSNATGASTYDIAAPTQDPDFISPDYVGPAVWAEIVPETAWFVGVNHPKVVGASAASEGLLVASGTDGAWHVWIVH